VTPALRQPLWTALEAAAATGGALSAFGETDWSADRLPEESWAASGFSIDTRTIKRGEVFVAIKDQRDGHDFVGSAFEAGAAAALVSKRPDGVAKDSPLLVVPDTMAALRSLAAAARDRNFGRLIGITGSAGKTSTKEMMKSALGACGSVHAASASFNNHLGVPLTLASLPSDADYGVFEIGMNHAGEITPLTRLVRPHVAIITTVAGAHLEFFDSIEGIAKAKAEILLGVRRGGTAILPRDNAYYPLLRKRAEEAGIARIVEFGETADARDGARLTGFEPEGDAARVTASVFGREVRFRLSVPGRHQAVNALTVLAAAEAVGADIGAAAEGLEAFRPGGGRGARHVLTIGGAKVVLIDESYNANPASMAAALRVLGDERPAGAGRRIAVIGDMKELGPDARQLHADVAEDVFACGVDLVHTAGEDVTALRDALPAQMRGLHAGAASELLDDLVASLRDGDVLMFKGSNASRVGALVAALLSRAEGAAA
jgi:UDP-N-acetylmuramoyl-tripeptide--D-alanyl-D-alanine ligase